MNSGRSFHMFKKTAVDLDEKLQIDSCFNLSDMIS